MPGTFFGWNVAVLEAGTSKFIDIFTDCELTLDNEPDRARAAHDLASGNGGYDCDVQKARSWEMRLGAVVQNVLTAASPPAPPIPCRRMFGWDLIDLHLTIPGTPATTVTLLQSFTRAQVRITNETQEARATWDTRNPAVLGWRAPSLGHRSLEIEIEGVVTVADYFDAALSAWNTTVAYVLSGGGVELSGDAIVAGGGLTIPAEGATQTITLRAHGAPSTGPVMANDPGKLLEMAASNTTFLVKVSRPNASGGPPPPVYQGNAIVTEATFEAPDGAAIQNATFMGVGPLAPV